MSHFINRLLFTTLALGSMTVSLVSCKSRTDDQKSDVKTIKANRFATLTYDYPTGEPCKEFLYLYDSGTILYFRCEIIDGKDLGPCTNKEIPNAISGVELQNAISAAKQAKKSLIDMQDLTNFLDTAVSISDNSPTAGAANYIYLSLDMVGKWGENTSSYAMTSKLSDQMVNPGLVSNGKKSALGLRVESDILNLMLTKFSEYKQSPDQHPELKKALGKRFARYTYDYPSQFELTDTLDVYESGTAKLIRCKIIDGNVIGECTEKEIPNAISATELEKAISAANEAKNNLREMQDQTAFLETAVNITYPRTPCISGDPYGYLYLDTVGKNSSKIISLAMTSVLCDQYVNPGLVSNGKKSDLGLKVETDILNVIRNVLYSQHPLRDR
jgi:hypothetical protein